MWNQQALDAWEAYRNEVEAHYGTLSTADLDTELNNIQACINRDRDIGFRTSTPRTAHEARKMWERQDAYKPHRKPHSQNIVARSYNCFAESPTVYIADIRRRHIFQLIRRRNEDRRNRKRERDTRDDEHDRRRNSARDRDDRREPKAPRLNDGPRRHAPSKRSARSRSPSPQKPIPAAIGNTNYTIPKDHPECDMLHAMRRNYFCATGHSNKNWRAREDQFCTDLATGIHARSAAFPHLTKEDVLSKNVAAYGRNTSRYRSHKSLQHKSDKANWNLQRKEVAQQGWDSILNNDDIDDDVVDASSSDSGSANSDDSKSTRGTSSSTIKDPSGQTGV
jgi:hypothetical protein